MQPDHRRLPRALVIVAVLSPASTLCAQAPVGAAERAAPSEAVVRAPAPEVEAEYRDVVSRAVSEFDAGRWAEARALFLRAHELWPSARTFRTLGMTSFELRAYVQAASELRSALDDPRRALPNDQRAQVAALLEQTRAFVGSYRVRLSPASAELQVDGVPVPLSADQTLVLEIGRHELRARADGYRELMRRVDVQGREDAPLALELQPDRSVAAKPTASGVAMTAPGPTTDRAASGESNGGGPLWTWIAAGTAVALAGTSTALWFVSDDKYDDEYARCHKGGVARGTCSRDEVDMSWKDLQTAHQITLGFAIGAGVAAVALFFTEGGDGSRGPDVAVGPGGVQVRSRF